MGRRSFVPSCCRDIKSRHTAVSNEVWSTGYWHPPRELPSAVTRPIRRTKGQVSRYDCCVGRINVLSDLGQDAEMCLLLVLLWCAALVGRCGGRTSSGILPGSPHSIPGSPHSIPGSRCDGNWLTMP